MRAPEVVRIEVATGPKAFGDPESWDDLVARAGGSFFQTHGWCRAWWETVANQPEIAIARAWDGQQLVGLAGLARTATRLHQRLPVSVPTVSNLGSGPGGADDCGFPVALERPEATTALFEWAVDWAGADPLLLANIAREDPLISLAENALRPVDEEHCPVARIHPSATFSDVQAAWTKNRRKTIRRKLQRYEAAGGTFRWVEDPEELGRLLETVFDMHTRRRADLQQGTRFGHDAANRALHTRLVQSSRGDVGVWVQVATLDDQPVGVLYGFRFAGTYYAYQSGWDPAAAEHSIGLIQYAQAYRHAVEAGGAAFDMCRGLDPYKLRFATDIRTDVSYLRRRGIGGPALALRFAVRRRRRSRSPDLGAEEA